jgi:hypothetical protein
MHAFFLQENISKKMQNQQYTQLYATMSPWKIDIAKF